MPIKLSGDVASNSPAASYDIRQLKKGLNRLGYYTPYEKVGITDIPDQALFTAIKDFQKDNNLPTTGKIKPDDETLRLLNKKMTAQKSGYYIWRTVEDGKVRPGHAQFNRTIRAWDDTPDPAEDYNCRCWAQAIEDSLNNKSLDAIRPVYPEIGIFLATRLKSIIRIISYVFSNSNNSNYTNHGDLRMTTRKITTKEINDAIKSAEKTKTVISKKGKYGTTQNHFKGSNGVTVIIETEGRNAGKIITVWRHK